MQRYSPQPAATHIGMFFTEIIHVPEVIHTQLLGNILVGRPRGGEHSVAGLDHALGLTVGERGEGRGGVRRQTVLTVRMRACFRVAVRQGLCLSPNNPKASNHQMAWTSLSLAHPGPFRSPGIGQRPQSQQCRWTAASPAASPGPPWPSERPLNQRAGPHQGPRQGRYSDARALHGTMLHGCPIPAGMYDDAYVLLHPTPNLRLDRKDCRTRGAAAPKQPDDVDRSLAAAGTPRINLDASDDAMLWHAWLQCILVPIAV